MMLLSCCGSKQGNAGRFSADWPVDSLTHSKEATSTMTEPCRSSDVPGPPFQEHVQDLALPSPPLLTNSSGKSGLGTIDELRTLIKAGRTKEAKLFVRDNNWPVTHPIRCHLWLELCQMQTQEKIVVENFYWDTVKQIFGQNCLWLAFKRKQGTKLTPYWKNLIEEADAGSYHQPAFVDSAHVLPYHLSPNGTKLASRIMGVVGYSYPAITFSPTVHPITCLLLHYLSEEDCYNSLCALLSWKHGKFIIQTKLMYEVSWRTVLHLTKRFAKSAYGNISKYLKGTETMEHVFEQWLWWIFKHLPFTHLVRVMDCFLFEGNKVLYRVALAILILFQKYIGKADNVWSREVAANGISSALVKFCQDIPVNSDKLLKVAFGIRALSQTEVNKIFVRTEMSINSRTITRNNSASTLVRSRSTEGIPTSQSQVAIQMISHTLSVQESSKLNDASRARSMGLFPFVNFSSHIITPENLLILWAWLPTRITMYQPKLIYTTEEHGCSLTTFYARVEHYEPTILVIKTTNNEIFGAYCSTSWGQRNVRDDCGQRYTYFGTGESFLFTITPTSQKYKWVGIEHLKGETGMAHAAELFMAGDSHMLTIGGGSGQGILLDEDIRFGRTETCQTFNNPPLCPKHDFECRVVEVFGFT